MKKIFLSAFLIVIASLFIYSCKKENPKCAIDVSKISSWLDQQKPAGKPNKIAIINLLKENLDFSNLHHEDYNELHQFIVIPIKEQFKKEKNISQSHDLVLLLVTTPSDSIESGSIVEYIPPSGGKEKRIPENTFNRIYNIKTLACNGTFQFLSVTGRLLFKNEYKDGKLFSRCVLQKLNSATARANECYNVYWHYYVYQNNVLINEWREFIATYCDDPACDDPNMASLCNDNNGSSAGGEVGQCEESDLSSGSMVVAETISTNVSTIDTFTKNKNPTWKILKNLTWSITSTEEGIIQLIDVANDIWQWKSLIHPPNAVHLEGMPIGGNVSCSNGTGTPSFTPGTQNVLYAGMSLTYTVTYVPQFICPPVVVDLPPYNVNYTSNNIWDARPI